MLNIVIQVSRESMQQFFKEQGVDITVTDVMAKAVEERLQHHVDDISDFDSELGMAFMETVYDDLINGNIK